MSEHSPTPWTDGAGHNGDPEWIFASGAVVANCGFFSNDATNRANVALIIAAVNNHAPMLKSLEHCAKLFDTLAQTMDRWANDSRSGGWSTHQVDESRKRADDCRRYAATIRSALPPVSRQELGKS